MITRFEEIVSEVRFLEREEEEGRGERECKTHQILQPPRKTML